MLIKQKVFYSIFIIFIFLFTLISLFSYYKFVNISKNSEKKQVEQLNKYIAYDIENILKNNKSFLINIEQYGDVQLLYDLSPWISQLAQKQFINKTDNIFKAHPYINKISFYTKNNTLFNVSSKNKSSGEFVINLEKSLNIPEAKVKIELDLILMIQDHMKKHNLDANTKVYCFSDDKKLLINSQNTNSYDIDTNSIVENTIIINNHSYVISNKLEINDISIRTLITQDHITEATYSILKQIFILLVILIIVLFFISQYIVKLLVEPFDRLEKASSRLIDGDFTPIEIKYDDETKSTLDAFNSMSQRIQGFTQELKEKIEEQTKDLLFYKNIFEDSSEGIFVFELESGKLININEKACKLLGFQKKEIIGQQINFFRQSSPTEVSYIWEEYVNRLKENGNVESVETLKRKDGTTYPVETSANYILEGDTYRMVTFTRDVTDKYQAEALKKEAYKIAKLGSWSYDLNSDKFVCSDELFEIFGLDKELREISYELFLDLIHPNDREKVKSIYEDSIKNKSHYSIKHRVLLNNGTIKWVQEEGKTTKTNNVDKPIILGTIQDITMQHEQEILIRKQTKMASLGEMIGNIAHQWRQPLSVISTGATGLKLQKEHDVLTDKAFFDLCDTINENAQYLSKTIDDFRNFIKGNSEKQDFTIEELINTFLNLTDSIIKTNEIKLVVDIHENFNLTGLQNELNQCLINLLNNSKDVFEERKVEDKYILIKVMKIEDKLHLIFYDNGGGIPKNIMDKVFEPYFTTKHQSIGTGLGLNMTYRLINEGMGGTIEVINDKFIIDDKELYGAKFTIIINSN